MQINNAAKVGGEGYRSLCVCFLLLFFFLLCFLVLVCLHGWLLFFFPFRKSSYQDNLELIMKGKCACCLKAIQLGFLDREVFFVFSFSLHHR